MPSGASSAWETLVELNKDMVMAREAFERLLQQTRRFLEQNGPSTVSQLKESLGISRRVAIPLFEKLDRDGMTRREGDLRSWKASLEWRPGKRFPRMLLNPDEGIRPWRPGILPLPQFA